ncbi:MAG TPA: sulfurtransferase [Acidimicrobiales bacterium]|nr:sulfurtransferase [Acidimicrobiales bacterium]
MTALSIGPLVTAGQLEEMADNLVLCDVRWYLDGSSGYEAYLRGHIPGAVFVDLDSDLAGAPSTTDGRHPFPSAEVFATSLGVLGIGSDNTVVAYDDSGGLSASRMVWMLRMLGQPAALLDGGLAAWSGPLQTEVALLAPVDCLVRPWPGISLVEADDLGGAGLVLDARSGERYRGDIEPMDKRAGHVPGAVNAPFEQNMVDGRFKSTDDLMAHYESLGVSDAADVVLYCGSGVSACHDLLAMEYSGLGRGRLYVGSWSQWSASDRPAATGPEPG